MNSPAGPPITPEVTQENCVVRLMRWLFCLQPREVRPTDPAATLYRSFHITAKCRYNASIRLKRLGAFSFLTATVLSLGLILIPLLQLSGIALAYPPRVLNMLEIFLAVAVLVYSVVNSTAHYETRAEALNECGDKIKELSRELRTALAAAQGGTALVDLQSMNRRYSDISTDSENHTRADYGLAMLQARDIYHITGLPRLWLHCKVLASSFLPYAMPVALMLVEVIIILDVLAVTSVLTPKLSTLSAEMRAGTAQARTTIEQSAAPLRQPVARSGEGERSR